MTGQFLLHFVLITRQCYCCYKININKKLCLQSPKFAIKITKDFIIIKNQSIGKLKAMFCNKKGYVHRMRGMRTPKKCPKYFTEQNA